MERPSTAPLDLTSPSEGEAPKASGKRCPTCGVSPDDHHRVGCTVARCACCGRQYIRTDCAAPPAKWTGTFPGVVEAVEFGFLTDPSSVWGQVPDLNRLYTSGEAEWSAAAQRWVLL